MKEKIITMSLEEFEEMENELKELRETKRIIIYVNERPGSSPYVEEINFTWKGDTPEETTQEIIDAIYETTNKNFDKAKNLLKDVKWKEKEVRNKIEEYEKHVEKYVNKKWWRKKFGRPYRNDGFKLNLFD